jgi:hypothetical protein
MIEYLGAFSIIWMLHYIGGCNMHDIYLYGSTLVTDSFILEGEFPQKNQYAEFTEHHCTIGGETGICLAILSEYGIRVKADGYHLGTYTAPKLFEYFKGRSVDLSAMTVRDDFEGFHDYVLIDRINNTRNCFGPFGTLPRIMDHPYNMPIESDIADVKCAAIDPFLPDAAEATAKYAVKYKVPYITIDCRYDSYLAENCAVAAISEEFLSSEFPGENPEQLMKEYMKRGDGLYIFTFGSHEVIYGRKGKISRYEPFHVKALSTLGAGDTFKCGCIYAYYSGMSDEEIVAFACAIAGVACSVYPLADNLPTLKQVQELLDTRKK